MSGGKRRQRGHGDYRLIMWILWLISLWPYVAAAVVSLVAGLVIWKFTK